jgi:hypothetical protein
MESDTAKKCYKTAPRKVFMLFYKIGLKRPLGPSPLSQSGYFSQKIEHKIQHYYVGIKIAIKYAKIRG